MRAAPIEPNDEGTERLALVVHEGERAALRGHHHALRAHRQVGRFHGKPPAHRRTRLPERLRVVLEPPLLRRRIAVERLLAPRDDVSTEVDEQRPDALGAAVDGEQKLVRRSAHALALGIP